MSNRGPYRHSPIDPNIISADGTLADFGELRPGDPPPPNVFRDPQRKKQGWGSVRKLQRTGSNNKATVISIDDLGRSYPINVQMRFAKDDGRGNPVLPWTNFFFDASGQLQINLRRGLSPDGSVTQTPLVIDGTLGTRGNVLPFDTVTARSLGVDLALVNATDDVWVEAIATEVADISQQNKIIGWDQGVNGFFAASNVLQQFLFAHPDRVQFVICNTSTVQDLWIGFGFPPVVGAAGTLVLPRNMFATYESPVGGWRGDVFGIWTGVGAGAALVTEGVYF